MTPTLQHVSPFYTKHCQCTDCYVFTHDTCTLIEHVLLQAANNQHLPTFFLNHFYVVHLQFKLTNTKLSYLHML